MAVPVSVVKLVTHENPHLDEIVAFLLLRLFGEKMFPGVAQAPVEFCRTGGECPNGKTADEYEKEGVLFIGTGRGRFDEHGKKRAGEALCAATLVAEQLDIRENPALRLLLKETLDNDAYASAGLTDLASVIKAMYLQGINPLEVINWATRGIEALYAQQLRYQEAVAELSEAIVDEVEAGGKIYKVVSIVSDNPEIQRAARSKDLNSAVVIQQKKTGHIQIFTNQGQIRRNIRDIVRIVRIAESQAKGRTTRLPWKELEVTERISEIPEWYYMVPGENLLNGSLTATDVPPTNLSFNRVRELVKLALSHQFDPDHVEQCLLGNCTHKDKPCVLFLWGFSWCRKIRYQQAQQPSEET